MKRFLALTILLHSQIALGATAYESLLPSPSSMTVKHSKTSSKDSYNQCLANMVMPPQPLPVAEELTPKYQQQVLERRAQLTQAMMGYLTLRLHGLNGSSLPIFESTMNPKELRDCILAKARKKKTLKGKTGFLTLVVNCDQKCKIDSHFSKDGAPAGIELKSNPRVMIEDSWAREHRIKRNRELYRPHLPPPPDKNNRVWR